MRGMVYIGNTPHGASYLDYGGPLYPVYSNVCVTFYSG